MRSKFRDTLSRCPIQRDWCKLQRFGRGWKTEDTARPARPAGASRLAKKSVSVLLVTLVIVVVLVVGKWLEPLFTCILAIGVPDPSEQIVSVS
jgi:hypothetical protein